jgi:hypothetical protein
MSTKIVIVAGQQFSVPAETDNEAIRAQLIGMGFADVQNATVKEGKQGETPTVEFVKKAGTKGGIEPADLVSRLRAVPRVAVASKNAALIVERLLAEQMTFDEAVTNNLAINAMNALADMQNAKGVSLCQRLDELPAVASRHARGW